jgi:23S rRNA (cytosine1962-C5)-methyltransferase
MVVVKGLVYPLKMTELITSLLEKACAVREHLFEARHKTAFRLFNGFLEGCPDLVVDVFATTAILHNYAGVPQEGLERVQAAGVFLQDHLAWLQTGIVKSRKSPTAEEKRGILLFGNTPSDKVQEHGVWYSLDLCMNQDTSFYLDTRLLRQWAFRNLCGKTVLNTFAYTGSLGVAAFAGGAARVVQLDLNRQYLNIAKRSCTLNGLPVQKADFIVGDFWAQINRFKRAGEYFDCVLVDPPFFSSTSKGVLDLNTDSARLINKVRPLINDGGWLVSINNALYVSGREYLESLEALCADGYLKIAELVPVSEDLLGYPETRSGEPITDPAPFNHSTKIAVLEVSRKRG